MKTILFLLFLCPLVGNTHPGVGIVKDSKGDIFYTDLKQVWKISKGTRTIVVPNVHTHELYVDRDDNLYGEGSEYVDASKKFYHYLWVYRSGGNIDTIVGVKEAFVEQDFSLSRDKAGNEYYIKHFVTHPDTRHIYRKSPDGKETIFAKGNFKGVRWLHPQGNGSLLYVVNNAIYKVDSQGNIKLIKEQVANKNPSFKFSGNSVTIWGVWQDLAQNIYVAAFSDQAIKKIDPSGKMTIIYKSKDNWAPLHGVFDNDNKLWILESSDKNDIRVISAESVPITWNKPNSHSLLYLFGSLLVAVVMMFYLRFRNSAITRLKSKRSRDNNLFNEGIEFR